MKHTKPVHLRSAHKPSPMRLWLFVAATIVLVVLGWMFTARRVLSLYVSGAKREVAGSLQSVSKEWNEVSSSDQGSRAWKREAEAFKETALFLQTKQETTDEILERVKKTIREKQNVE